MSKPRGVLIAGNWKMNYTAAETAVFFSEFDKLCREKPLDPSTRSGLKSGSLGALIFPPMLSVQKARALSENAPFSLEIGAQNAHWEKKGAFTGEVSGPMLAEIGLGWVLIGHSERRQYFGETDETVRKRTESLLAQGFRVMMCIGETRAEREAGQTQAVLTRQIAGAMPEAGKGAAAYLDGRLVLAYEPVWAIGTGLTATPEQAEEAHRFLRELIGKRYGSDAAEDTPLLYGGSVTPENIDSLLVCNNVDGALVGGASLKPESFLAMLAAGGRILSAGAT
jgi:triosephosphate isomerase